MKTAEAGVVRATDGVWGSMADTVGEQSRDADCGGLPWEGRCFQWQTRGGCWEKAGAL